MGIHYAAIVLTTGVLLSSLAPASALAQGRGRGQAQGQALGAAAKPAVVVQFTFHDRDRDLILKHYSPKGGGSLPPGLEKQLRRNGTLPPGLQKKVQPFPRTLLSQLRPLPTGYRYGIADGHVIIYRPDTFVIADIMLHVVR